METEKDLAAQFERKKRELLQQEQLRVEMLDQAMAEWLANPKISYADIGKKYGFSRTQVRYHILKRTGQLSVKRAKADKDTETFLRVITLQQP